jgi:hypothetical protein
VGENADGDRALIYIHKFPAADAGSGGVIWHLGPPQIIVKSLAQLIHFPLSLDGFKKVQEAEPYA